MLRMASWDQIDICLNICDPLCERYCHRNFGPGNFGPGDQNFQWKIGPAGPIFPGKMVRLWKIGPNNGPSISALVTSDCCG